MRSTTAAISLKKTAGLQFCSFHLKTFKGAAAGLFRTVKGTGKTCILIGKNDTDTIR
jgi:hypothetical protein